MTQDEIIRMAREADLYSHLWGGYVDEKTLNTLERFANLVAEATKEKAAKVCEKWDESHENTNYGKCLAATIRGMK